MTTERVQGACPNETFLRPLVLDDDLLGFVRSAIRSTWALELLLLLRGQPGRTFGTDEAVLELRATRSLISTCAKQLQDAGLIVREGDTCRYAPASPTLDELCARLEAAYGERPVAVINAIVASPNDRLKSFADAFRFTKKDE